MSATMTGRDIVVCGAGPVGAACALFLAQRGVALDRIALLDARGIEQARGDDRMIAISHGSATLLARIGAWRDVGSDAGAERYATAIHTIHVSHRARFGRTVIHREDYGVPALGYVIRLGDLVRALDDALSRAAIPVLRPFSVAAVDDDGDRLRIVASDDPTTSVRARFVIHAEGGLFDRQARRAIHRDYGQTAVTAFVTRADASDAASAHTAFERFTEAGPIALLPAKEEGRDGYSLVWCGRADEAVARLATNDAAFLDALHAAFGDRLGRFASTGPRRAFPLGLNAVSTVAKTRALECAEFAIGNAAQTLHPVAGQGLNLGLRDAFTLAGMLAAHTDGSTASLVSAYVEARRADRRSVVELTDFMPRVFARQFAPVAWGRGLSLALLDASPSLRGVFARQMMNGRR